MPELTLEFAGNLLANRLNFDPYFGYGYENHARAFSYWNYLVYDKECAPFGYRDSEGKRVLFFSSIGEDGRTRLFKAYRNYTSELYFVNEPVAPPFLDEGELVHSVRGLGTYFIVLRLTDAAGDLTRAVLVKTATSDWDEWTDYVVLDEYEDDSAFYYDHESGNSIKVWSENEGTEIWYCLFDQNFTYLISPTQLFNSETDATYDDPTNRFEATGYLDVRPNGLSVTYDRLNEEMVIKANCYIPSLDTLAGTPTDLGRELIFNFSMAKSTLADGVGLVLNNIPYGTGDNYALHAVPPSENGVCYGKERTSFSFDEYYEGGIISSEHDWDQLGASSMVCVEAGTSVRGCVSTMVNATYIFQFLSGGLPCALSVSMTKTLHAAGAYLIATGELGGANPVPTAFKISSIDGDTIIPDDKYLEFSPETTLANILFQQNQVTTVMVGMNPSLYGVTPITKRVHLIYDGGVNVENTPLPVSLPSIPEHFTSYGSWTYNGDNNDPTFYFLVTPTFLTGTPAQHEARVLRYHQGDENVGWGAGWYLYDTALDPEGFDESKGDGSVARSVQVLGHAGGGTSIHTDQGHIIFVTEWETEPGYTKPTVSVFDPATDSVLYSFRTESGYGAHAIGWHPAFGYYATERATTEGLEIRVQDTASYEDFFSGAASTIYKLLVPRASGPYVHIKQMPIFVGGRFTDMHEEKHLDLQLNKTNYVYVEREFETPFDLRFFVVDQLLPNNFHRALLAEVVCDAHGPISQKTHKANWKA